MDHEQQRRQRQQHSPRGNAPGSGRCGASSGKHKAGGGGGKGGGKKPIKVVYISNPMRVKTSAAGFRALVQELTGRDADPSKYSPEDLAGAADAAVAALDLDCAAAQGLSPGGAAASSETIVAIPSRAAAGQLPDAVAEAAPHGGDYDDDEEEDEDGFGSQLLENNYTVSSPPTLLYDHHPHSKLCSWLHAPNLYAGVTELLAPIRFIICAAYHMPGSKRDRTRARRVCMVLCGNLSVLLCYFLVSQTICAFSFGVATCKGLRCVLSSTSIDGQVRFYSFFSLWVSLLRKCSLIL